MFSPGGYAERAGRRRGGWLFGEAVGKPRTPKAGRSAPRLSPGHLSTLGATGQWLVAIGQAGWDQQPCSAWRNGFLPQSMSRPVRRSSLGPSCHWWGADGRPPCPAGTLSMLRGSERLRVGPVTEGGLAGGCSEHIPQHGGQRRFFPGLLPTPPMPSKVGDQAPAHTYSPPRGQGRSPHMVEGCGVRAQ